MIKRLHELSKKELKALGTFMRGEIKPADMAKGSNWVCQQLQRPHFWSEKQVAHMVKRDRETLTTSGASYLRVWVALESSPVGLCGVMVEPLKLFISTFLIDDDYVEAEQFQIADALAKVSLAGLPDREEIYSLFNKKGFAARFATRCGFECRELGKSIIPDPNPLLYWWMNPEKLAENIKKLAKA